MKPVTLVAIFFLSVFCASASAQQSESPAIPEKLVGLPERWTAAMEELHVPGMAVVVVRGDEVIYQQCFGKRDVEKQLRVTPRTTFYIASCTKTFLATAVVRLSEEGLIDLDAPVSKYLPKFRLADAKYDKTNTVRDLLLHAKGIDSTPIVFLDAYSGQITEQRYYDWLAKVEPTGEPTYTNVHYTLLGRVVESVTGHSWKDVLQQQIFDPLEMKNSTAYASNMYSSADAAIPAVFSGGQLTTAITRKSDRTMHAAGGMGASIVDLAAWLRFQLNRGQLDGRQIIAPESIAEMHRLQAEGSGGAPRIPGMSMKGFGLSWFVTTYKDRSLLQHGGGYVGCSASISFMPEEQIGVAVVSNTMGVLTQLVAFDIYDRLLDLEGPDLLPRVKQMTGQFYARFDKLAGELGENPAKGGLSLGPAKYIGNYENELWGTAEIELIKGELTFKIGDMSYQLGSVGVDKFAAMAEMGQPGKGRFELSNGKVTAIVFKFPDYKDEVVFSRN